MSKEFNAWFTVDELNAWAEKKLKENPHWAEQPAQQEPVAWVSKHGVVYPIDAKDEVNPINDLQPLYTSPPAQRKPLTDEEMAEFLGCRYHTMSQSDLEFFRLGEAAHNIKENT